jgi:hypothetical protein
MAGFGAAHDSASFGMPLLAILIIQIKCLRDECLNRTLRQVNRSGSVGEIDCEPAA